MPKDRSHWQGLNPTAEALRQLLVESHGTGDVWSICVGTLEITTNVFGKTSVVNTEALLSCHDGEDLLRELGYRAAWRLLDETQLGWLTRYIAQNRKINCE